MHQPARHTDADGGSNPLLGNTLPLRVLAVCAVVVMLQYAAPVLLPLVLSLLLFYALDPVVDRLESWGLKRIIGSVLVVVMLAGGVLGGAYALWPQFSAVLQQVPESAAKLRTTFREQRRQRSGSMLRQVQDAAKAIDSAAAEVGSAGTNRPGVMRVEVEQPWRASDILWTGGIGMIGLTGQAVTILFLTIFLLNEDDSFKRKLVRRMETLGSKRVTVQILNDIAKQIERFIWVQAFTSLVVAVVTAGALYFMGVNQPIVWGLFAGVMNVIPYFGPLIVSSVLAAVAFLQFSAIAPALGVAATALAITSFEGMLLTPHLISRAASLNHVAVFVAIAFWSWAWGVPGMLLAVPMLMACKAICDHVDGLQVIGELLGE